MLDIVPFLDAVSTPLVVVVLVTAPIAWIGTLATGARGKNARKVLSILFRQPPE